MQQSKSKLFLIELIIIILFFSIASAVCMNIFARGKVYSNQSTQTTMATLLCQQAAETFKGTNGDEAALAVLLGASQENGRLVVEYDGAFAPTAQDAVYRMEIAFAEGNGVKEADIVLKKGDDTVYALEAAQYMGMQEI
ncbi:MAG: hypothetical protein VB081_04155 [Christensenella sp.]|uniref:hypothetical protein n=1 Tax=Christensenella sp. TaxID=1935934 RepID=UPI002B202DE2|nr:hypothetical protein [Christensenella sp.]MEA5002672.1 hypothetical protein [Christensenella sp.]